MPRRYKKRAPMGKKGKRRFRRKRKFRRTTMRRNDGNPLFRSMVPRGPLPMRYCCSLPYVSANDSLDPGAGTVATRVFRLNGCFDPDTAVGGHQPLGFDEMSAFYHNYTVIGAKATVFFSNSDTTTAQYVGAFVHQSASPTIVVDNVQEQGMGSYTILSARTAGHDTATGTLVVTWSARKWFGTKGIIADPAYTSLTTADPTTQAYLVIWGAGRGLADTSAISLDVRIEYIVVFTNPQYLVSS